MEFYPNPTTGIVNIALEKKEVISYQVFSNTGTVILNGESNESNLQIDLSVYERGVYFISVDDAKKKKFFRVIKL